MTGPWIALAGVLTTLMVGIPRRWRREPGAFVRGIGWFAVSSAASGLLLLPAAIRAGQDWFLIVELATAFWVMLLALFAAHWRRIDADIRRIRSLTALLAGLEIFWLASSFLLLEQAGGDAGAWLAGGGLAVAALAVWHRPPPLQGPSWWTAGLVICLGLAVLAARTLRPEAYDPISTRGQFEPVLFATLLALAMARETVGVAARRLAFGTASVARIAAWTHAVLRLLLVGVLYGVAGTRARGGAPAADPHAGIFATLDAFAGFGPATFVASVAVCSLLLLAIIFWSWALVRSGEDLFGRDTWPVRSCCVALVLGLAVAASVRFADLRPVWAEAVDLVFGVTGGWVIVVRGRPSGIVWLLAVVVVAIARPWLPDALPLVIVAAAAGLLARMAVPGRPAGP